MEHLPLQKDKKRAIHETQQSKDESWRGAGGEIKRAIGMVTIKSFHFNRTCSIIVTELKTNNSQRTTILHNEIETGSSGSLMPINILKVFF